jgi:hypothetical protein
MVCCDGDPQDGQVSSCIEIPPYCHFITTFLQVGALTAGHRVLSWVKPPKQFLYGVRLICNIKNFL